MNFEANALISPRRVMSLDDPDPLDPHGFLEENLAEALAPIESVLQENASVVLAPPWFGKSVEAKRLATSHRAGTSEFGQFHEFTSFEESGYPAVDAPKWWSDWRNSQSRHACWIIDAVDEDFYADRQMSQIIRIIQDLSAADRSRLHLVIFARQNEYPAVVQDALVELYPDQGSETAPLRLVRLAPISARIAATIAGGADHLDRVKRLIEKNDLRSVAGLPIAVKCLSERSEGDKLSVADLWRDVLHALLRDRRQEKRRITSTPRAEDAFQAARRIGAVLSFSGQPELAAVAESPSEIVVDNLFSLDTRRFQEIRIATWHALRSGVFKRKGTGYLFAQRHTREWFAAFELEKLPLAQIRPLFQDEANRPIDEFRGIAGLLYQVTKLEDVRNWILELYDGVPPRSDAAPMTRELALMAVNRLMALASRTPFGLPISDNQVFRRLAAPGLGDEVAKRLEDTSLPLPAREILLDIAEELQHREVVPIAKSILWNQDEDDHLRLSATLFLRKLADDELFREAQTLARSVKPTRRRQADFLGLLIQVLYDRRIWSLPEAVQNFPGAVDGVVDFATTLMYRLQKDMTPSDARQILGLRPLKEVLSESRPVAEVGRRKPYRSTGQLRLFLKAIEVLASQESISDTDLALLEPAALLSENIKSRRELTVDWPRRLLGKFSESPAARRRLYLTVLREAEVDQEEPDVRLWRILRPEDLEWLSRLVASESGLPRWFWKDLLALGNQKQTPVELRDAARMIAARHDPRIVEEFDARVRAFEEHVGDSDAFAASNDDDDESKPAKTIDVSTAVGRLIEQTDRDLHSKALTIAWLCFCPPSHRPYDVAGAWDELSDELRDVAQEICIRALRECTPTPIPEGDTSPISIFYEAYMFSWAVANWADRIPLTGEIIRKWLPAVISWMSEFEGEVLRRCHEADSMATEDILFEETKREARVRRANFYSTENFPAEFWSSRLADLMRNLVNSPSIHDSERAKLLRIIAKRMPGHFADLATAANPEEPLELRLARVEAGLRADPEKGLVALEQIPDAELAKALEEVSILEVHGYAIGLPFTAWAACHLERLFYLLNKAFPPETDPEYTPGEANSVGRDDHLRRMRQSILDVVWKRGTGEDQAALDRISTVSVRAARWLQIVRSHKSAEELLRNITPVDGESRAGATRIPVSELVRLLEDGHFRLIRSNDDLQRVVVEALGEIEETVRDHLTMLYHPARAGAALNSHSGHTQRRKRLEEEALQAYLQCRLKDLLPGRVLGPTAKVLFLSRETLASRNQRLDIKVQAPTLRGPAATVIIEVKWSDNSDVSTSLRNQLGEDYLINQMVSHGIYVVGWCGPERWKAEAIGSPPVQDTRDCWLAALESQAIAYKAERPHLSIAPKVMDLTWPSDD